MAILHIINIYRGAVINNSLQLSLFGISLLLAGNLAVSVGIGASVYIAD